jgi:hypothetical protein
LDAKRHQRSSGAVNLPGRGQATVNCLSHMGVWRDSFAAKFEETGAMTRDASEKKEKQWRLAPPRQSILS